MPWSDLLVACLVTVLFALPLALTAYALLDAARRPQWAWALADRHQALWMAFILLGVFSVIGGVVVCVWYLVRVRPLVVAAESGRVVERSRRLRSTDS